MPELSSFPSPATLATAVATKTLDHLLATAAKAPTFALSGGRIAKDFFSALARQAQERGLSLAHVHFFWADERCVPPDHVESNYRSAAELLFAPLSLPGQNIHRIRGEEEPDKAACEAEAELRRFASMNAAGQPVLDLILLGMGEDGHVASLFPGEPEDVINSPAVYRPVTASKPPPKRITLGHATIAAARNIWVLASGAGKETALRSSLAEAGQTPLARVLRQRPDTRIFTDIRL